MHRLLRILFVLLVARPVALLLLGINIRQREKLRWDRQALIVANHNSHLDTLVLLSTVPLSRIHRVHPAAAEDYFLRHRFWAWLARHCVGVVAVRRSGGWGEHPLAECLEKLRQGHSLILYPEGTRGEPEQMQSMQSGIAYLSRHFPALPVIPVFLHGLGRALPKGEWLLIPFFCDVFVGDALVWPGGKRTFLARLDMAFASLRAQLPTEWMRYGKDSK
jgi:1-acyl-sn-glycerol-3-phosphate acyltransferase